MSGQIELSQRLENTLNKENAIDFLRTAIGQESITGNEANFVKFLYPKMQNLHLDPEQADFAPGRPNVWGTRKGSAKGKNLLFIGHTDTVHVKGWNENWAGTKRQNPFGAARINGEIWGRGAGDLKAGICASLAAVELLDQAGISLLGNVSYAFVGDEESGEPGSGISAGIKDFTTRISNGKIQKPDFAIYVEPTRLQVFTAQMGFFIADIKITGKSAYFGVPEQGVDALKAAHKALAAIWKHSDDIAARVSHDLVGKAFVLVTGIEGGGYIAVPGECSFSLIHKLLPGQSLDIAVNELEKTVRAACQTPGISVEFSYPAGRDHKFGGSPAEVSSNHSEIALLCEAMKQKFPERGEIKGAPYWSEAPFLINQIDCPTVYCAPGDITNCHTLEERVSEKEYLASIVGFATFIARYCGINQ